MMMPTDRADWKPSLPTRIKRAAAITMRSTYTEILLTEIFQWYAFQSVYKNADGSIDFNDTQRVKESEKRRRAMRDHRHFGYTFVLAPVYMGHRFDFEWCIGCAAARRPAPFDIPPWCRAVWKSIVHSDSGRYQCFNKMRVNSNHDSAQMRSHIDWSELNRSAGCTALSARTHMGQQKRPTTTQIKISNESHSFYRWRRSRSTRDTEMWTTRLADSNER